MSLVIKNLHANVQGTEILKGINLEIPKGEVHAIMGPNGSGKSTLSKVLCGHPDYEVTEGEAWLDGQNLLDMSIDERSRAGLFLAFQYPMEVPGVSNANFLRAAMQARMPHGEELDAVTFYMGPNGSGKSTLSKVLCGHPDYEVTEGEAWLDGQNLLDMSIDERSRAGLFLAFQYPMEVPGVSNANFLRAAMQARMPHGEELDAVTFYKTLYAKMDQLGMARKFTSRAVNEGFSGGEKKRNEVLQMLLLDPLYAILDETDSGLDIDALRIVSEGVNSMRSPFRSFLVITHYKRLLDYIRPDVVHVLADGRIVRTGGGELVDELESRGYEFLKEAETAEKA